MRGQPGGVVSDRKVHKLLQCIQITASSFMLKVRMHTCIFVFACCTSRSRCTINNVEVICTIELRSRSGITRAPAAIGRVLGQPTTPSPISEPKRFGNKGIRLEQ